MHDHPDPGRDIHVVWWRFSSTDAGVLRAYTSWLSASEQTRMDRFRFEPHRLQFLASRILLRQTLGAAQQRPPDSLQFSTDAPGCKPALRTLPQERPLHFSLTHTDDLVACALTRVGDVGIDAEAWARRVRLEALVARVLSAREAADLADVDPAGRARRFLEYWTIKEAWLKAVGTGLRTAPSSAEVTFGDGHPALAEPATDAHWRIHMLAACADHAMALAAPRRDDEGRSPLVIVRGFELPAPPVS